MAAKGFPVGVVKRGLPADALATDKPVTQVVQKLNNRPRQDYIMSEFEAAAMHYVKLVNSKLAMKEPVSKEEFRMVKNFGELAIKLIKLQMDMEQHDNPAKFNDDKLINEIANALNTTPDGLGKLLEISEEDD